MTDQVICNKAKKCPDPCNHGKPHDRERVAGLLGYHLCTTGGDECATVRGKVKCVPVEVKGE